MLFGFNLLKYRSYKTRTFLMKLLLMKADNWKINNNDSSLHNSVATEQEYLNSGNYTVHKTQCFQKGMLS